MIEITKYQALCEFRGDTRVIVVAAGRRWGKTELCRHMVMQYASIQLKSLYIVPNYQMSKHILTPAKYCDMAAAHHLTGISFDDYQLVVVDEAGMIPTISGGSLILQEITRSKANALIIGTPAYEDNSPKHPSWFRIAFNKGFTQPRWMSYQFPTWSNPYIAVDNFYEARKTTNEDMFNCEFGAQFLGSEFDE